MMELHKLVSDILQGRARVLSFDNIAPGLGKDITAATLCALNFVRLAFAIESKALSLPKTLGALCTRKTVENAFLICREWSTDVRLEVEDVYRIPLFEASLKLASTDYDTPSPDHIAKLLENLNACHSSSAIILARYPHIIACLRLHTSTQDVFVLFNPCAATPGHGQAASLTLTISLLHVVQCLCDLFPTDKIQSAKGSLDWQAKLLEKCTGHLFVPRATSSDPVMGDECLIVSSLTLLTLKAEFEQLTRDNGDLKQDKVRLEKNISDLGTQLRQEEQANARRAQASSKPWMRSLYDTFFAYNGGPPSQSSHFSGKDQGTFDSEDEDTSMQIALALSQPPSSHVTRKGQDTFDSEAETDSGTEFPLSRLPSSRASGKSRDTFDNKEREEMDPNIAFALQLQATFDSEHDLLQKQHRELLQTAQRQHHCGVCLDDFPEDDAVRIDACGHDICRDCARGHVVTKIEEHRFPVLCPVCMADQKNQKPGTIPGVMVQLLGISEKQWETWVEMEMAQFSVPFDCRKCRLSGFLDRQDLDAEIEIHCPFPACDHVWCKTCQQTIAPDGPKHSCDGTAELDHLMKQQGWRYCPNCKTPIQKSSGCNHLSCIAPGCNTHFCYRCGATINRTAVPGEILEGKMAHYRTCTLI